MGLVINGRANNMKIIAIKIWSSETNVKKIKVGENGVTSIYIEVCHGVPMIVEKGKFTHYYCGFIFEAVLE